MSVYGSDPDLNVQDVTGNGTEVDVATNLLNGDIRLSILWAQEILLSADAAEEVANALRRAAAQSRIITGDPSAD
jgi:predicted hydrolase (HD superfamily)